MSESYNRVTYDRQLVDHVITGNAFHNESVEPHAVTAVILFGVLSVVADVSADVPT